MAQTGGASARELSDGFKKAADEAIAANKGIAPSWVKAQAAVRGYQVDVDAAGKASLVSLADAKKAANDAASGFREVGNSVKSATEALRAMGIQADQVSGQVQGLIQQGQMLAAGFQQRQDNWNSDLDKSKYMNQGKTNPVDAVPTFNSSAEAEAWWASWNEQYLQDNPYSTKRGGQLGSYMYDLTKFEYDAELRQTQTREKMEAARKAAEAQPGGGSGGGGSGGGGGGGGEGGGSGNNRIDRIVNLYIGNSQAYSVPTNQTGQRSLEELAREVLRVIEAQHAQLGY